MRDAFDLDPSVVHLNHGSYGAVPRVVTEAQHRVRALADANPMRFQRVEAPERAEQARAHAADFLEVGDHEEVALIRNVTQATATVLGSLADHGRLSPGDVIVVAQHTYESVRGSVIRCCRRTGATYETVRLPLGADDDAIVASYRRAFARITAHGRQVRLVITDQITSPTGALMPVSRICAAAGEVGALTFVDAAHGPGHVDVQPPSTGADFWTGTWHKWGFAPHGTSVLWVRESERDGIAPLTTSRYDGQPYPRPFDWCGTDDTTGWYCLADAIRFWRDAGGTEIAKRAEALLDEAARIVAASLAAVDAPLPAVPSPCMRLVALPAGVATTEHDADTLYESLSALGVEAQVVTYDGRGYIRLSAAVYNTTSDYERLAEVLTDILA